MNKTKTAILSISLLNILMNAGIVPVLSRISAVFPDASPTALKLTLSISALFSIIFSLLTGYLDRFIPKKVILAVGLFFYAIGGMGTGLANSMAGLLAFRALLGVGAGICLPLATAFIADFYQGEERKETIGYSFFAANLAAMILPVIGARLVEINWRYAFSVYGIALLVLVFTWINIPDRSIPEKKDLKGRKLFYFSGPVASAAFTYFFVTMLFLSLPSNISVFLDKEGIGTPSTAALIGSVSTIVSMFFSLNFARIYGLAKDWMLTAGLAFCGLGFIAMSFFKGLLPGHPWPEPDRRRDGHVPPLLPIQSRPGRSAGTIHQRALAGQFGFQDGDLCLALLFSIRRLAGQSDQYPGGISLVRAYFLRDHGDFSPDIRAQKTP